jgi:hypothetical protein
VEEYHKSLKTNASMAKWPTKTIRTHSNHCFASIYAFVKLEWMKLATKLNRVALRSRLFLKAVQAAFRESQTLRLPSVEPSSCVKVSYEVVKPADVFTLCQVDDEASYASKT